MIAPSQSWSIADAQLPIAADTIHIWRAELIADAETLAYYWHLLSEDERQRAERLRMQQHRWRYIISHGILHEILSLFLEVEATAIEFIHSSYGKPDLAPHCNPCGLKFNLSHSQDIAVYAISMVEEVGIDVEYLQHDYAVEDIAQRFFSVNEYQQLMSVPDAQKRLAFYNAWTRKEAFIKAVGQGLSYSLSKFDVSLVPGEPAKLLRLQEDPEAIDQWTLHSFTPHDDYVGALALRQQGCNIQFWEWEINSAAKNTRTSR